MVKAGTNVVRLLEKPPETFFYSRLYRLTFLGLTQYILEILLQVQTYKSEENMTHKNKPIQNIPQVGGSVYLNH